MAGALDYRVTIGGTDVPTDVLTSISIKHGRGADLGQADAGTATVQLLDPEGTYAKTVVTGRPVLVDARYADGDWSRRFTGTVTGANTDWSDPDRPGLVVAAATSLALLGRRYLGVTPGVMPAEDDGDRAERILSAASLFGGITIGEIDPGTVGLLSRQLDSPQAMLTLAHGYAEQARGLLWQSRDGRINYADAEHRRGTVPAVSLGARQLLATTEARLDLAGLVNDVGVSYGVTAPQGQQPTVREYNAHSIAEYGLIGANVTTELADQGAAEAIARLAIGRGSIPTWDIQPITVELSRPDLAATDPAGWQQRVQALLDLEVGSLIEVAGVPDGPTNPTAKLWVEGWAEDITGRAHVLSLEVSDYGRTGAPPRWVDVCASIRWVDVDPAISWLVAASWDAGCGGAGRWVDVPAARRWATWTPPEQTWADLN